MKAIRINEFGGPEVMKLEEVARPVPAADEILVKVYATSVNPADYVIRKGGNNFLRPYLKLPMPLGLDAAGIVEEVGNEVTTFKTGDKVYGIPNFLDGGYTEYLAAKANKFALMPHRSTFNEAGAIPSCALIAWNGIVITGKAQPGQRVLIHGAAGGVGSLAVQFAKAKGAYVIGTASANNADFLKSIGADEVIDYKNQKFEDLLHDIDVVFNASPVRDSEMRLKSVDVLKEGGIFVCTQLDSPFSEDFLKALAEKNATTTFIGSPFDRSEALGEIAKLIDDGKVKVIISKIYSLAEVAEAHRESETNHVRGKLVLEVRKEN
ncbi:MAG: NADP-dependent oxidoreductase [Flavipsychrobacter sp.]|nr:NADP-dependent oxidoreductase [Flavipsychrobacter sp.]